MIYLRPGEYSRWLRISLVSSAVSCALYLIGQALVMLFTDEPVKAQYLALADRYSYEVKQEVGEPMAKGDCRRKNWIDGYAKPSVDDCDSFWVYQEYWGIFYVFFNKEQRVTEVQYRGG